MKKYLLTFSALCMASNAFAAIDCSSTPSCDSLGYTKSQSDCLGQEAIRCPFDISAYYCADNAASTDTGDTVDGATKCKELGFTNSKIGCLTGQTKRLCIYDLDYYKCTGDSDRLDPYDCPESDGYFKGTSCPSGQKAIECVNDASLIRCVDNNDTSCPDGYYEEASLSCPSGTAINKHKTQNGCAQCVWITTVGCPDCTWGCIPAVSETTGYRCCSKQESGNCGH